MADYNIDELVNQFGSGSGKPATSDGPAQSNLVYDINSLTKEFGSGGTKTDIRAETVESRKNKSKPATKADDYAWASPDNDFGQGLKHGIKSAYYSIGGMGVKALGALPLPTSMSEGVEAAKKYGEEGAKANRDEAAKYENPDAPWYQPTAHGVGNVMGEVAATAPVMSMKLIQGAGSLARAIPYAGFAAKPIVEGALGGAAFGAGTYEGSEQPAVKHIAENALAGAVLNPVVSTAVGGARKGAAGIVDYFRNKYALAGTEIDAPAAKKIISVLEEAGLTPAEAKAELARLGSQATIGDINPATTAAVGGLAKIGGEATNIIKSRYADRAAGANTAANDLMETRLGVKPDFEVEKEAASAARDAAVGHIYRKAHSSKQALDVEPLISKIDKDINKAVGPEKDALKTAKSYLYDEAGNVKVDIEPLHKVRQQLDAEIKEFEKAGAGSSPKAIALNDVRKELNARLKTNNEMAAADTEFSKLITEHQGLDYGKTAIGLKPNVDKFTSEWNAASPEKKEYIRKGLRVAIGDIMEQASKGELAGAQQLLGKKAGNREIVRTAFGKDGEEVLDELAKHAKMRYTENRAQFGSDTAENLAVSKIFGMPTSEGLGIAPLVDIAGGHGLATGFKLIQNIASNDQLARGTEAHRKMLAQAADVLSRSGYSADQILAGLEKVAKIKQGNKFELPNWMKRQVLTRSALPVATGYVEKNIEGRY